MSKLHLNIEPDTLLKLHRNIDDKIRGKFLKHKIKYFAKISWNYENKNLAGTLLLHNLPSAATHPPLPSAKRFFNAARQCYFEMKTNKEPFFSILSSIILWCILYCISKKKLNYKQYFYFSRVWSHHKRFQNSLGIFTLMIIKIQTISFSN